MRVLVLGGTGAMGAHLCELLAESGHEVVCTTRRKRLPRGNIFYAMGDAKNHGFLDELLGERWGAVVDFMLWTTSEFRECYRMFLNATNQYVFMSSYRVYADSPVISELSPRLLDVVDDPDYLATDEYALRKARCEDMLFESGSSNWTIVRPTVTYDGANGRLQLGVFESRDWLWRAMNGVPVPMPVEMLGKQATMSYGGDSAKMISRLVGNPKALGEAFTVSGDDHMAWGDVAEAYAQVLPFEVTLVGLPEFGRAYGGVYQIRYDRMFDRIIDNSKVLKATGVDTDSLTCMHEGLERELRVFLESGRAPAPMFGHQGRYDCLCGGMPSLGAVAKAGGVAGMVKYLVRRWV